MTFRKLREEIRKAQKECFAKQKKEKKEMKMVNHYVKINVNNKLKVYVNNSGFTIIFSVNKDKEKKIDLVIEHLKKWMNIHFDVKEHGYFTSYQDIKIDDKKWRSVYFNINAINARPQS